MYDITLTYLHRSISSIFCYSTALLVEREGRQPASAGDGASRTAVPDGLPGD